jgi:hypothetical protein
MPVDFSYIKDPGATLDYSFDWTDWLGTGELLSTATWTVPAGLTKVSEINSAYVATCRISGGVAGVTYTVTCQVTTDLGEIDRRSLQLVVQNR